MIQPCRSAKDVDELVVVELHARMRWCDVDGAAPVSADETMCSY